MNVLRAAHSPASTQAPYVVIGAGPVGLRAAQELLQRTENTEDAEREVWLFGDEPWLPYNRAVLSCYLAGEVRDIDLAIPDDARLRAQFNLRIASIDPNGQRVMDVEGHWHHYHRLILATGSRPRMLSVPGIELTGVHSFRHRGDADRLKARTARSRSLTVVGGGILGLEIAKALSHSGTHVRIIEHNDHLMFNQLDAVGGQSVADYVARLGIEVITGDSLRQVLGVEEVTGIMLRSGRLIDCDTLIIAAGIQPNIDLAREAGLSVGQGIRVDDQMQTSDPSIFAAGECAEHRGIVYGLVAPGFEQASVAAHNAALPSPTASYPGSVTSARLKVVGLEVFSTGDIQEPEFPSPTLAYQDPQSGQYRRLFLSGNRLRGAVAIGHWHETNRLQEAITAGRRIWPWQRARFRRQGILWATQDEQSIFDWPESAAVCNCTGVSLAQLQSALAGGACTQSQLSAQTGAGSVCGSCRPLLAELVGSGMTDPVGAWRALGIASAMAVLIALLILFMPAIPYNSSVQDPIQWDQLWRDSSLKQWTGFSLLGLAAGISVLGLRKRLPAFTLGRFDLWRLLHVLFGVLAIAVLLAHTGLRLGDNLNLWLMLSFLGVLLAGGVGGAVIAIEHRLHRRTAQRWRKGALWAHLLLVWPLPVLLGFHIIKGYWY